MAKLTEKYPELRESAPLNAQDHPELSHIIESNRVRKSPANPKPWNKQKKRPKRSEVTNVTEAARISEKFEEEWAANLDTPKPTDAAPGTTSKLEVLAARMSSGQKLHHPEDAGDFEGTLEQPTSSSQARI